jgi:ABC transporter substrate binding protein
LVADDAEFTAHRATIAELALKRRMPTVSGLREMVDAGGLMAYGASFGELYRRAASHVHKILQGGGPANLPVEQPTRFELVLNLRTARALGVEVPTTLLGAVATSADPIFTDQRERLIALAKRHAIPVIHPYREHVLAGGLMSYGPSIRDAYRQVESTPASR